MWFDVNLPGVVVGYVHSSYGVRTSGRRPGGRHRASHSSSKEGDHAAAAFEDLVAGVDGDAEHDHF